MAPSQERRSRLTWSRQGARKSFGGDVGMIRFQRHPAEFSWTATPEVAAEWHPSLNRPLTPGEVKSGSGRKVWWSCDPW
ncbi:MAG: zinc-ribbon domain-containing protein [Gemmatimonadales bacterium]